MGDAPIAAVDERGRRFKEKKLVEALRVPGIEVPDSFDLRTLGLAFSSAGLDPNRFVVTSGLTDPQKEDLKAASDDLEKAVDMFSDTPANGRVDSDPWEEILALYDQDKGKARVESREKVIDQLNVATHRKSEHPYVWDEVRNVYDEDGEQAIRSLLVDKLGSDYSRHEFKEILEMVRGKTYRTDFDPGGYIPVGNGDLEVDEDTVQLHEPTPERGFRNRSPAKWDPGAEAPDFQAYLEQVVPVEKERMTLQEYIGYALMHWALLLHKALFLVGPQASGKSTLLKIVAALLGKTTQLSPQQLVDQRFGAIELEDSWANIRSDIPNALLKNVGKFKELTAGDLIHVERKFEQGYAIEPTAKHFYSANQLPEIKIDDDAFFRRVLIVAFPKTIPRKDRDSSLPDRLMMELDGILRWAVEGLQRLMQNEGFTRDLSPEDTRRLWDEHSSSIGRFKIQCLNVTGHSEDVQAKQDVYRTYTDFCMERGLPTESQNKLTRVLKRDPRIGQGKRTPEEWDKQTKCYIGVQLPSGDSESDPPF